MRSSRKNTTVETLMKQINDLEDVIAQKNDQIIKLEDALKTCQDTAISMITNSCPKHTGPNAPTWEEFRNTITGRCHICDVKRIKELEETVNWYAKRNL